MTPPHFLMRISFSKINIKLNAERFVFHTKINDRMARPAELEDIQSLFSAERVSKARYEELMKETSSLLTGIIYKELGKGVDESVLFNPNEDNKHFVDDNNEPTDFLYRIISKGAEETLTFVRQNIKKSDELEHRLQSDEIYKSTLEWGLIKNLQALINRAKTELLLVKGGECSLMEGFVNCNSKFGKERYGNMTEKVFENMEKTGLPASMLFIDLDNFKQVNDQFGHDAGDEALKRTADLITKALRIKKPDNGDKDSKGTDERVRFGGEEIGIIMEQTSENQAVIPANRIREFLEQNPLLLRQHVECTENGEDKKSRPAHIAFDRFTSLIEKNGIGEIEIGDNINVPKELTDKLKGKKWKIKKSGRGMKIILPDQRNSNSQIILIHIPITASIGVAEFSNEMMADANANILSSANAKSVEDLKDLLQKMDITEGSPFLTESDKVIFSALTRASSCDELKAELKMNSIDEESFRQHIQHHMKGMIIRRSFAELRNQADEKVYDAKEAGRNCIAVGDFVVRNKEEIAMIRELAMSEKGRKSFPPYFESEV